MRDFLEVVRHAQITMPSLEVMLLFILLSLTLLLRANRIGLVAAYLFVYRWGWIFFQESFGRDQLAFQYSYILMGGIVLVLSVISMFRGAGTE